MALIIGKRYIFNLDFKSAKKRLKTVAHGKSMTTLVFVVFFLKMFLGRLSIGCVCCNNKGIYAILKTKHFLFSYVLFFFTLVYY